MDFRPSKIQSISLMKCYKKVTKTLGKFRKTGVADDLDILEFEIKKLGFYLTQTINENKNKNKKGR